MNQSSLEHNIFNLKGTLPLLGKLWVEDSSDELAQQIRYYEAIINFDPDNCDDARKSLVDVLYEAAFFKPWDAPIPPPPYVEYNVIKHEPSPYAEYKVILEKELTEQRRADGGVEIQSGEIITLPCFGIQLLINVRAGQGKVLQSDLTDDTPFDEDNRYVAAMRAIEIMILSHALCDVNVCDDIYVCGIEAAVEECGDFYG